MEQKQPIFDRTDQAALLKACNGYNEYVPVWLMLRLGVPPKGLQGEGLTVNGDCVCWLRPDNLIPRRALVPKDIMPKINWWISIGRKRSPDRYNRMVSRIGARIKHTEYTFQTLLNSNCINQIRDSLDQGLTLETTSNLVAERMGRKVNGVKELYLEYEKWRAAGGEAKESERLHGKDVHNGC